MRAYVGQTRKAATVRMLAKAGIGECTVRGEMPPRRATWFYDNGAFGDWRAQRSFNVVQYMRDLRKITYWSHVEKPAFIILPDLVARGLESLAFSLDWLEETERAGAPIYLAVQDGMTEADLEQLPASITGIFVGGSLEWKLETAAAWIKWAHARGLKVHIGRVGTIDRVRWARSIGADSIDSAFPLWTEERLAAFVLEVAA